MTDLDVDALLEQQLEATKSARNKENDRSGRDRERSERDGDRGRGRDRDRSRERKSDRDHWTSRDRSRERGSSRRHRSNSRERHARSSRDRSRDRRDSHRHRDSDRPDRHRDSHRDRARSRDKQDEPKAREPPAPRKPRTPTPERELRELHREACTVMAFGLSMQAEEWDIFEFFSQAGELVDVKLIKDKNTKRSKGIAYIEFKNRSDVMNALQLTGRPLKGVAVLVKSSEAEKNFAWEAQQLQTRQNKLSMAALDPDSLSIQAGGPCRLQVSNVPTVGLVENDIRELFAPFGNVQSVTFDRNSSGRFTGVAYVQYATSPEGNKARQQMNGIDLVPGHPLEIKIVPVMSAYASASVMAPVITAGELDEGDEMGGLRMNASSRTALMARMSGAAGIEALKPKDELPPPPARPAPPAETRVRVDADVDLDPGIVGSASPIPTATLLLKNMFDPAEETEPNWEEAIQEDTKDECSKYGEVIHCHVDPRSKGFVYLKFATVEAAQAAQRALHGRWYANKQIVATFQFTQMYNSYFRL